VLEMLFDTSCALGSILRCSEVQIVQIVGYWCMNVCANAKFPVVFAGMVQFLVTCRRGQILFRGLEDVLLILEGTQN